MTRNGNLTRRRCLPELKIFNYHAQTKLIFSSYLASFFTDPSFQGSELKIYGEYEQCINLPEYWSQDSISMTSNEISGQEVTCCVFTASNCNFQNNAYTPVPAGVATFLGVYKDGGVKSLVCNCWKNAQYWCASWVPPISGSNSHLAVL